MRWLPVFVVGAVAMVACVSEDAKDREASAPASCETYCREIAQKCGGQSRQYRDNAECMTVCGKLDVGTLADGDVNSIGCRLQKLRAGGASLAECVAAGPYGGGVCGSRCGTFCKLVTAHCASLPSAPYGGNEGTCSEICSGYVFDATEGEGPDQPAFPGKNTLNCRAHHMILATKDPTPHCFHADVESQFCTLAP